MQKALGYKGNASKSASRESGMSVTALRTKNRKSAFLRIELMFWMLLYFLFDTTAHEFSTSHVSNPSSNEL